MSEDALNLHRRDRAGRADLARWLREAGQAIERGSIDAGSEVVPAADVPSSNLAVEPADGDLTGEEWRSVVAVVLEKMGRAGLAEPEEHLSYVRNRIRAAVARHVV